MPRVRYSGTVVLWHSAVVGIVVPVLADYNLCPPIVSSTHSHTSQSVRVTFLLTNCVDFCACLVDCCRHEGSPGYSPSSSCCCCCYPSSSLWPVSMALQTANDRNWQLSSLCECSRARRTDPRIDSSLDGNQANKFNYVNLDISRYAISIYITLHRYIYTYVCVCVWQSN